MRNDPTTRSEDIVIRPIRVWRMVAVMVSLVVGYFVFAFPIMYLLIALRQSTGIKSLLYVEEVFMWPAGFLAEHVPAYAAFINWLLGPLFGH